MNHPRKANIKTVAELAGVSIATVSRALKSPERVARTTLERVERAVAQCGYTPNSAGRTLRTRRSGNVVVMFPDITRPFNGGIINGIESVAHDLGYSLLLGNTRGEPEREHACANMIFSGQADGMILLCPNLPFPDAASGALLHQRPPLVNASEPLAETGIPKVLIDNTGAARMAVNHLIELGHRRIAIITGEMASPSARERLKGYKQALGEAGIAVESAYIQYGNYCPEAGISCAHRLLQLANRPTAIFCCDDEMAIGAMQAARSCGLAVPDRLSLVGFDDIWAAEHQNPSLTTIRQPVEQIGRVSMRVLYGLINGRPADPEVRQLPVELVVRDSTCPPRKG
jgi:LacI family repressor for deo operon, udp, cdd, tsx, nupC, and nupG